MEEIIRTTVARTQDDVIAMADLWRSWQYHPNSDIDGYLYTLAARSNIISPYVIAVLRGNVTEALVVGRYEWISVPVRIGYGRLFELKVRAITFLHGGVLGRLSLDASQAAVRQILWSLRRQEADVAFFNHLQADSHLHSCVVTMPALWSRDHFPSLRTHRAMTVPESIEAFRLRLSPKVRKNQRWQAKKLEADHAGNAAVRCFRGVSELEVMFRDVEEVARSTYQRGLGVGFVDSPETRGRLELSAQKGWLRAFVLYVAGVPWAFWIGMSYGQTFHSDCMGYDPAHSRYSPGMYLLVKVIEHFCGETSAAGIKEIDFGLGDAHYKELLGDREWQDVSAYIFGPSMRSLVTSLVRIPALLIERVALASLQRTPLVSRIRRSWRVHMRRPAISSGRENERC